MNTKYIIISSIIKRPTKLPGYYLIVDRQSHEPIFRAFSYENALKMLEYFNTQQSFEIDNKHIN